MVGSTMVNKTRKAVTMKTFKTLTCIAASVGILTVSSTSSFGLAGNIFTFDENGNGNLNGVTMPGQMMPDLSGGLAANVLIYQLPFLVMPGDVGLLEPLQTSSGPSDLVRFFNPAGANFSLVIFYSDVTATDPPNDLADTGLPVSPNAFPIPEVGPEGNNGAVWIPVAGQPGFDPTGAPITYNILSDVPEPGSMLLAGLSGGLLLLMKVRRQVRRA
jgi:hypothetical protein